MISTTLPASRRPFFALVSLSLLALAGCGGGGSGSNNTVGAADPITPPPVQPPPVEPPPVEPPPVEPPPTGTALLSWYPPTEREDGTPLRELDGYRVFYGQSPEDLDIVVELPNPGLTSYLIQYLDVGTWYFSMTAFDEEGRESARSGTASKTIT